MDQIRPIKTDADYEAALAEIERLFDAVPDTPESDVLEVLVTLVEAYESKHYSIPLPDPIEAIMYHMESRGLSRRDVEPFISRHAWIIQALTEAVAPPDFEAGLVLGFTELVGGEIDPDADCPECAQPFGDKGIYIGFVAGKYRPLSFGPICGSCATTE